VNVRKLHKIKYNYVQTTDRIGTKISKLGAPTKVNLLHKEHSNRCVFAEIIVNENVQNLQKLQLMHFCKSCQNRNEVAQFSFENGTISI
jgi:hypothetical protein